MRELILHNKLGLPSYQNFVEVLGPEVTTIADKFFKAMWKAYIHNKGTVSLPYWSEKFQYEKDFNTVLKALATSGWIETKAIPERNWAEANINEEHLLKYVTADELLQLRAQFKFDAYVLKINDSTKCTATRLLGKTQDTGLIRVGSMKSGNTLFAYDTNKMEEYKEVIQKELIKGMEKVAKIIEQSGGSLHSDKSTYDSVSLEILDYYQQGGTYTRGNCLNDSRGRAISDSLSKVGNPIGSKPLRALLEIQ